VKRPISPEEQESIRQQSAEGMTYWQIASQYPHLRQHEMREAFRSARDKAVQGWCPDASLYRELMAEVQAHWTPEQWSQRWVGRYARRSGEDLQSAASKLMPY
jgi:hypothetical protein